MARITGFIEMVKRNRQIRRLDDLIAARRHVYPVHPREIMAIGPYAAQEWARRSIERAVGGGR